MSLFRPSLRRLAAASASATRQAAREALKTRPTAVPFTVIPTCPTPSCPCADMPPDLDIERSQDLNGTMVAHSEHLIIPSGQSDWASKIEDERNTAPWGELVATVKDALGREGEFHNPYHNIVISTCSFETPDYSQNEQTTRALLFPSFKLVDRVGTRPEDVSSFVRTFLLPKHLNPSYVNLTDEERSKRVRDEDLESKDWAGRVQPISAPTIMVCSHHSRDSRCGILGPLLHAEFSQYINKRHSLRNAGLAEDLIQKKHDHPERSFVSHPEFKPGTVDRTNSNQSPINVGMLSHIGGHKFAGNVLVFIPPDYHCAPVTRESHGTKPHDSADGITKIPEEDEPLESYTDGLSPLAGKTIWYGRVEPRHVEGIVEQTIGHGKVIRELFRGGVNNDGTVIRL